MEQNIITSWYVIDTSICGYPNLNEKINEIMESHSKIIITSVVISELDKLQKSKRPDSALAAHLLALAAEHDDVFIPVQIEEPYAIADDNIIEYCIKSDKKVTLLTSDKTMALNARMKNIETIYLKRNYNTKTTDNKNKTKHDLVTLSPTVFKNNTLYIVTSKNSKQTIRVFSNGLEYNGCSIKLHVNDDIYIITKKDNYLSFAHYKLASINKINNSFLIFSKRIYSKSDIKTLNSSYKSFIRDCMIRFDL